MTRNTEELAVEEGRSVPGHPARGREAVPSPETSTVKPSPRAHVHKPSPSWPGINFSELWRFRELFFFVVWRDIKVRYAQTVLGAGWAILQPVLNMVVFTLVFGNFAKVPSEGVPYPIFSLTGLVIWTYFATALNQSGQSLVGNPALITKIYFPRLVIPFAPVLAGVVDLAIAFIILVVMMAAYSLVPSLQAVFVLPLFIVVALISAAGAGCWLAALNIQYRDIKYVSPFLVQVWMYMSPVVYPMSSVPARFRVYYSLNPMAGVIEAFRAVLLRARPLDWGLASISIASAVVLFATGTLYFRHTEKVFADVA